MILLKKRFLLSWGLALGLSWAHADPNIVMASTTSTESKMTPNLSPSRINLSTTPSNFLISG